MSYCYTNKEEKSELCGVLQVLKEYGQDKQV